MKTLFAYSVLLAAMSPAAAQTPAASPAPTPAPAPAAAPLSLDSSIEVLMADPKARAVVLVSLPDIEAAPGYDQFKVISLRKLQPHSGGQITDQHLAAIESGLKALPAK